MKLLLPLFFTSLIIFTSCDQDCNDANIAPDGPGDVDGKVVCIENMPFEGAHVTATLKNGTTEPTSTDANGEYTFIANKSEISSIAFSFDNTRTLRLTTTDLVVMREYILGINTSFNTLQQISMDLNDNGVITSLDVVLAEKMLLGENDPPIERWQFIRGDYQTVIDSHTTKNSITVFDHIDIPIVIGLHKADPYGIECP